MSDGGRNEWQEAKPDPSFKGPGKRMKKTRLFADANFPEELVAGMRKVGLSVLHANQTGDMRHSDDRLYQIAKKRKVVILTMDKDFWNDREHPLQGCPGVILVDAQGDQAVDAIVLFYHNALKVWPGDWWDDVKVRATARSFTIKFRTRDGKTGEHEYREDARGRLLLRERR